MKKDTILVTGGAGFIGSHTVHLLLNGGHEVIVYDNFSTGRKDRLQTKNDNLYIVPGDILNDELLKQCVAMSTKILHLAAIPSVSASIENTIQTTMTNTIGFIKLLEAIRPLKEKPKLVYASSAAIYGDSLEIPCNDEILEHPSAISPYALDKQNNEKYANLYKRLFDISSIGLRYFNVYGDKQNIESSYSGVISKVISAGIKNELFTIYGDGMQSRDFIHVTDVARANYLALFSDYTGVINIGTGVKSTIMDIVEIVKDHFKNTVKIKNTNAIDGDIRVSYAKTTKAIKSINFSSKINVSHGLASLVIKSSNPGDNNGITTI